MIRNFTELLARARDVRGRRVVVVAPSNAETFEAIAAAREQLAVSFLLVGDRNVIQKGMRGDAQEEIVHQPEIVPALIAAFGLLRSGEGHILLKGGIDTATLMKGVLHQESGLRTGKLLSDVFVFEDSTRPDIRLVMITDGGLTLAPDVKEKVSLIGNAVRVAHALGNPMPKVAVLSASEFVNPDLPSSVDAAMLAKMNERGQITGCIVDGPLALDNALSGDAAREKQLASRVAGEAEILVAPGIEAANLLAKGITIFGGGRIAHVIMGARVPILIPSRADKADAKLLSIALGLLMSEVPES